MTKKYHVFSGASYYPCGGSYDYNQSFISQDDALEFVKSLKLAYDDWFEIMETQEDGSLKSLRRNID